MLGDSKKTEESFPSKADFRMSKEGRRLKTIKQNAERLTYPFKSTKCSTIQEIQGIKR